MAEERTGPRDVRLDARNLKGIAHPVRVRMLALLRSDGPATASGLARRLGINSGATSYHLRMLAEHGFVVEVPDRGLRRERWWEAAHDNTMLPASELLEDDTGEGAAFLRSVAQVAADNIVRAVDTRPTLPEAWQKASAISDYLLMLTPEETSVLVSGLHEVVRKRRTASARRSTPPSEARRVVVQLQVFPILDDTDR